MAKERKPYTGGLVRPMGIPNVSFAQFQELATGASSMQRKLDTVVNFALKQEEAYQIKRGEEDAISNPITANQYLDASPAEREALLGGEKYTTYGKSVQATQLTLLTSEMAIKAQKDFNALKVKAYTEEMNLDDYEANLNAIVNGYTDAIAPVNPQAAISIKSDLTTKANSFYSSYADKLLKEYKTFKDIEVVDYGNSLIDSISDEFKKGHMVTIVNQDNVPQQISIDDHLNIIKNKYKIQLSSEGMSKEDFVKWDAAWDAKVLQEKKNILYGEFVDKPANLKTATQTMKVYKEVINGNFNGNQKLQSIYNSLDEDQQTEFKSTVRTWKNNNITALEDAEKAFQIDIQNSKDDIEIKYLEAVRKKDYVLANSIVDEAKGLDDGLYLELLQDIQEDVDQGAFLNTNVLSGLLDDLFAGTLNPKEIDAAYTMNEISLDQKRDLKEKLITKKNSAFTAADKYMRNAFAYPESGIITLQAEKSVAFEQYRNSANALMDYMFQNPDADANDIMMEAKRITESINTTRDINAEIKTIRSEVTNKTGDYGLSTKAWDLYFRKFYKEDYTNINDEFLKTSDGIDLLITELEELKELENGMKYKVDDNMVISEGGYFTDKFTRPGNLSNATINKLIDRLGVLKSYLEGATE